MGKIQPRNLPAQRLERLVVGNPVTTRLESGVANCYPGLEFDHRNLDRRFFPGLVFNFVDAFYPDQLGRAGVHLVAVDTGDPALQPPADAPDHERNLAGPLRNALAAHASALQSGDWYVERIAQGETAIDLVDTSNAEPAPLYGGVVWRMVRMLAPKRLTLTLSRRRGGPQASIDLVGWRRRYIDLRTGLIDGAYAPGELAQSLCSPWMHDFRDCSCTYWASNHPDIVIPPAPLGAPIEPTNDLADPLLSNVRVDWLRGDRFASGEVQAPGTKAGVRQAQIDHYEINERWQDLGFVLESRESADGLFRPNRRDDAPPFGTPLDLAKHLVYAASLEHVLALEYLYARYTIVAPDQVPAGSKALADFATFARHELLMIAVGEMRHMRWANELLWSLQKAELIPEDFPLPALAVADRVPLGRATSGTYKNQPIDIGRYLWSFGPPSLEIFTRGESPSGALEGLYSNVLATFRHERGRYPQGLLELAEQIVSDGVNHYASFQELLVLSKSFADDDGTLRYARPLAPGNPADPHVENCVNLYAAILVDLAKGYATGDAEDRRWIPAARDRMTELDDASEVLARSGSGVPYFPQPPAPPQVQPANAAAAAMET